MQRIKDHWQIAALTLVVFACWQTPLVAPLKILVVFFHELSHGLAAVLTGGRIEALSVSLQQGGHAITRGGNVFVIYSAGYLGSLVIGAALWLVALKSRADRAALALCGAVLVIAALLYMRDLFAIAFCLGAGAALLAAARYLGETLCDQLLRLIGLTSMIYVPYDIYDDTIARSGLRSDARLLAEYVGGPTVFWGALWLLVALVVIALTLRASLAR